MERILVILVFCYVAVVLYLDVFKWDWFSKHQHRKLFSMYDWIEDKWGEKGVRIAIGVITIFIMALGIQIFLS